MTFKSEVVVTTGLLEL